MNLFVLFFTGHLAQGKVPTNTESAQVIVLRHIHVYYLTAFSIDCHFPFVTRVADMKVLYVRERKASFHYKFPGPIAIRTRKINKIIACAYFTDLW